MAQDTVIIESAQPTELSSFKAPVLPPITKAGVSLFKLVLLVTVGFGIVAVIGCALREYGMICALNNLSSKNDPQLITIVGKLYSDVGEFRKFWMDAVQMVMINVLLPILTGLLGYIFGTRQT